MEAKKVNTIAVSAVIALILLIIIARVSLGLSETFFLIAGADIAGILAIFAWAFFQYRVDHRRKLLERQLISEGRELRIEYSFLRKVAGVPTKFRYKELETATDNFQSLIGQGASASVFKGILSDGTPVAVKRIEGEEHGEKEFRSEVAAIASVQHFNLVRLLGYCCIPEGPRFLVYEFVHNGSLDAWIFPQRGSRSSQGGCLSWNLSDSSQRKWSYFPRIVTAKVREGKIMEVVDERLLEDGGIDEKEVRALVNVALWCIQENARLRPSMTRVVEMLEGRVNVDEPPVTEMVMVDLLSIDQEPNEATDSAGVSRLATRHVDHQLASTSTYSFAMSALSGR
ncbi:hypothetical protein HHK36_013991 [Tetracentron sinense]|uniref:Protein kinase domain-containing protein n=1 Tax=Tetracentron sinense TaxID=13715 RepID=A0A834Z7Z9_TETSI|nr:hypothetical protein HHK36_013991 [Tetracentron sinense]